MPARPTTRKPQPKQHRTRHIAKLSASQLLPCSDTVLDTDDADSNIQTDSIQKDSIIQTESNIQTPQAPLPKQAVPVLHKGNLVFLLKQVHSRMRYGLDTLLVSLLLLKQIEFRVDLGKEKLLAAALLEIAAKVHEYRTPQFSQLSIWGDYSFGREELVAAEGQLLIHLNFNVPAVLSCRSLKEADLAVRKAEGDILGPSALSFQ